MNAFPALLALDAAFGPAAACLALPDGRTLTAETDQKTPHSQSILPVLDGLVAQAGISWRQLDMLALGIGPGSFTGLRVAAAIIAGINADLGLPVLSLSSLAVTAVQANADEAVHVIEDARSGLCYAGCYRKMEAMQPDRCLSLAELAAVQPAAYASRTGVAMPGWQPLSLFLSRAMALARLATARAGMVDAGRPVRLVLPRYMQPSQAERKAGHG